MRMNSANRPAAMPLKRVPRWPTVVSATLLLLLAVVGVVLAAQVVEQYVDVPPDFDEAVHLLPVRQLAVDVGQGDVAAFVRHTLNQDELAAYPFMHAWLTFPVWLVWPSLTAVRLTSLLSLIPSILLAFAIGHDLLMRRAEWRWLAGLVSGGLLLGSFPLWVYGALAYLEGAGLCLSLLALWLYGRSGENGRWAARANRYALLTSLAVTATFFTKYNFGLFLMGGIALNEIVQAFLHGWQGRWRRWFCLGGITAVLLLFWFIYPGHWARFWAFGSAQEGGLTVWQWESWLYYGRSLFQQYLVGWPFVLLVGAGLVCGGSRWRDFSYRSLLCYLVVSWLLLIFVPQKAPRFLYTVAPAVFPLAGVFVVALADWWRDQEHLGRWLGAGLAVLWALWATTAVFQRFQFFEAAVAAGYSSTPETAVMQQFVGEQTLAQNQPVVMLNGWHLFSAPALQWSFYTTHPHSQLAYDEGWVTTRLAPEPTPENLERLLNEWKAQGITIILSIDGSPAGAYSGWAVVEPLLAQGAIEPLVSSEPLTIPTQSFALQEALLAGEIGSEAELKTAVEKATGSLALQLHLYRIR